ncbi:hypothetical protein BaRGS_00010160 [Batillaria attramentaria]|uniref:Uncharacterized protein n=1 Tax=Batillaria attramentaria TaxID=370345 RepID=A0ABD0LGD9_9CAEN
MGAVNAFHGIVYNASIEILRDAYFPEHGLFCYFPEARDSSDVSASRSADPAVALKARHKSSGEVGDEGGGWGREGDDGVGWGGGVGPHSK